MATRIGIVLSVLAAVLWYSLGDIRLVSLSLAVALIQFVFSIAIV